MTLDPNKAEALAPGDTQGPANEIIVTADAVYRQDLDGDNIAGWSEASVTISWSAQTAAGDLTSKTVLKVNSGAKSNCFLSGSTATSADGGCTATVDNGAPSAFLEETAIVEYGITLTCDGLDTVGTHLITVTAVFLREDGSAVPPEKAVLNQNSAQVSCNAPPTVTPTPTPTDTSTPTATPSTPTPTAIGGFGTFPDLPGDDSGSGAGLVSAALAAVAAAVSLGGAAWYTRRRWLGR